MDSHVLHIVYIDQDQYVAELIKANDGRRGREVVSSIAKRSFADVAINGGFFEIGGEKDGKPSGTLVINGIVYGMKKSLQPLLMIDNGILTIHSSVPQSESIDDETSMLSGIPMLVENGVTRKELFTKNTGFYSRPHARTAIGIDATGVIVIVVAEHYYSKDIGKLTIDEVQEILRKKREKLAKKDIKLSQDDITLGELKHMLKDEFSSSPFGAKGLTILELANIMRDLGCQDAINLDGGGSSTLYIENKVVNNTIGDSDEGSGKRIERPVSDAIIFKKK